MSDEASEEAPRPARRTITIHDLATGAVRYVTQIDEGREDLCCDAGQGWVPGEVNGGTHRIDLATGEPAPLLQFDLVIDTNLLAGIPAGTTVIWRLETAVIDDGVLEFETEGLPEDVQVRLLHPIYIPAIVSVPCA